MSAKDSSCSSNKIDARKHREQRLAGEGVLLFPQTSMYSGSPTQASAVPLKENSPFFVNPSWKDLQGAAKVCVLINPSQANN